MNFKKVWIGLGWMLFVGCTEDSVVGVVTVDPDSCIPNQSFSCPCVMEDGSPGFGVQTCNPDGVSYSECVCSIVPSRTIRVEVPVSQPADVLEPVESDAVETKPETDSEEPSVPDVMSPPEEDSAEEVEEDSEEQSDADVAEEDVQDGVDTEAGDAQDVAPVDLTPTLTVDPAFLDFGFVNAGDELVSNVTYTNAGAVDVGLSFLEVDGEGFSFSYGNGELFFAEEGTNFDGAPLILAPGETFMVFARFAPDSIAPALGTLRMTYGDESGDDEQVLEVPLEGNFKIPAMAVTPAEVNFGVRVQGDKSAQGLKILSQGAGPLILTTIALSDDSSSDYELDFTLVPGYEDGSVPSPVKPLVLEIKEEVTVLVRYDPAKDVEPPAEGGFASDAAGTIQLVQNTPTPVVLVPVTGTAVVGECPIPVIDIKEGNLVTPQTVLHLDGTGSYSPNGAIVAWSWTVEQPDGSNQIFQPSSSSPTPSFQPNVVGPYVFELSVIDETGASSCASAKASVLVLPEDTIAVELVWDTPGDLNPLDEGEGAGSDLDLHFMHPSAAGLDVNEDGQPDPWFDVPWDVFWVNPKPNWENPEPFANDDPSLDRDDKDGMGPETITLGQPIEGNEYPIAVHYWSDNGFGPSTATVRVYVDGNLNFEASLLMNEHDLWDVGTLSWPSGVVAPSGNGAVVYPGYIHPGFPPPQ